MKLLNCIKMRLVLVGFVAAMVLGGGSAKADFIMSEPTNLGPVINDARDAQECDFSHHDGLELYFAPYNRPGGFGGGDIWVATRETLDSPLQEPVNLGPNVNSSGSEVEPSISGDGLELYFGCWDDYILRVCTRPSKDAPWSTTVKIGPPVGSDEPAMEIGSNDAWTPEISADGLSLYFTSTRVGGYGDCDIWVATRATTHDPWGEPVNLGPNVNSGAMDWSPSISTDGLTLIFSRQSPGSLWATTRKSTDDDWGPAVQLPLHSPGGWLHGPALSPDGSTLYLEAYSAWGGYGVGDFWQIKFIPIVDFNSDGVVDAGDMCIMVDNWHTDNPLCDIAPLPLGDGYVDVQDLIVLAEHLFEEVVPPAPPTSFGSFTEDPPGTYTMTDRGGDIWDSSDQFHFAYKTLTGPGSVVARIDSITNTNPWAKAGVMIRETLDRGSKHALVCVTSGNGVAYQSRSDTNGTSIDVHQTGITPPRWVKLERDAQGNLTAAHSHDGTTWQSVAGAVARNIPMNPDVYIGLALTSINNLETCQAVFSNVTITGDVASQWANQDVGPFGQP